LIKPIISGKSSSLSDFTINVLESSVIVSSMFSSGEPFFIEYSRYGGYVNNHKANVLPCGLFFPVSPAANKEQRAKSKEQRAKSKEQ
jgi:hypothetical protein